MAGTIETKVDGVALLKGPSLRQEGQIIRELPYPSISLDAARMMMGDGTNVPCLLANGNNTITEHSPNALLGSIAFNETTKQYECPVNLSLVEEKIIKDEPNSPQPNSAFVRRPDGTILERHTFRVVTDPEISQNDIQQEPLFFYQYAIPEEGVVALINLAQEAGWNGKQTEDQLRQLMTIDPLTGIYNRAFFVTELHRLQKGIRHIRPIGHLLLDVDGLKWINDNYGHEAGDQVLKDFATALKNTLRSDDIAARIAGDEFAALLLIDAITNVSSPEEIESAVLQRLEEQVQLVNREREKKQLPPIQFSFGFQYDDPRNIMPMGGRADAQLIETKQRKKDAGFGGKEGLDRLPFMLGGSSPSESIPESVQISV